MSTIPTNALVWCEIPVTDLTKAIAFYSAVFDWELLLNEDGPNPLAMFPMPETGGAAGHLYPGKPATGNGPTVHLSVPDTAEAAAKRAEDNGGAIVMGPVEIPVGRFIYVTDPDGNSLGLFEYKK